MHQVNFTDSHFTLNSPEPDDGSDKSFKNKVTRRNKRFKDENGICKISVSGT
jgi:hypothetical protein